jgi:glutamyl-tRNA synthetase
LTAEARASNAAIADVLSSVRPSDWSAANLEALVKHHAEATATKLGSIAQPLRAALTGKAVSPPVFDVLAVLGRDESLARLKNQP